MVHTEPNHAEDVVETPFGTLVPSLNEPNEWYYFQPLGGEIKVWKEKTSFGRWTVRSQYEIDSTIMQLFRTLILN